MLPAYCMRHYLTASLNYALMPGLNHNSHLRPYLIVLSVGIIPVTPADPSIPPSYRLIAQEHQIPSAVLYGVALTESQLKLSNQTIRPWPWTLNVAGVPRRYPTRIAAWKSLNDYLEQGIDLIDVGIMQVNWHYHHQQLGTPWEALEPFNNTRAGAKILKAEYQTAGDWPVAIGRYHSPGQKPAQKLRAQRYARKVLQHIQRIQGGSLQMTDGQ